MGPGVASLPSVARGGYAKWLVASLQDPGVYGESAPVVLRETAISWVFFAEERVYKLKKPVSLPFVDYSTAACRRAMCHEEVRLNRRLAPEIYVGVRAIVRHGVRARLAQSGDARAIDHVVEMRRYDESATAAAVLQRHEPIPVDAIGRRLAAFHRAAPACRQRSPVASWETTLAAHFSELRELLPARALVLSHQERLAQAFLARHGCELERRARLGSVRDGHGDLRAEQVTFCRRIITPTKALVPFTSPTQPLDGAAAAACATLASLAAPASDATATAASTRRREATMVSDPMPDSGRGRSVPPAGCPQPSAFPA